MCRVLICMSPQGTKSFGADAEGVFLSTDMDWLPFAEDVMDVPNNAT